MTSFFSGFFVILVLPLACVAVAGSGRPRGTKVVSPLKDFGWHFKEASKSAPAVTCQEKQQKNILDSHQRL